MRYNGVMQYLTHDDEDVNEYGEPVAGTSEWSDDIECSVKTIKDKRNYLTHDGETRVASYQILIPYDSQFPWNERNRIKVWRNNEFLGEFDVIKSELASSTGRQVLTV